MFEFIIFCGPPGVGKTSQSTAELVSKMIDPRRYNQTIRIIESLNSQGYNFKASSQEHFCYSNYSISANVSGGRGRIAYDVDPAKDIALPNSKNIPYRLFYPGSVVSLTEVQLLYPSSKYRDIPEEVTGFYQNGRHFGLSINMDLQNIMELAKPIRNLATSIRRCLKIEVITKNGNTVTKFHNLEFSNADDVDEFESCKSGIFNKDKKYSKGNYVVREYNFNPFDCYSSTSNSSYFLPRNPAEEVSA